MMMNTTLAQLRELKLAGMVAAIEEQVSAGTGSALCFEERLALMVDREVQWILDLGKLIRVSNQCLKRFIGMDNFFS